jgi:hypothetical protein
MFVGSAVAMAPIKPSLPLTTVAMKRSFAAVGKDIAPLRAKKVKLESQSIPRAAKAPGHIAAADKGTLFLCLFFN